MEEIKPATIIDVSKPVLWKPMNREVLIQSLFAARDRLIPDRASAPRRKYNDLTYAIRPIESFLSEQNLKLIMPDEKLLDLFFNHLQQKMGKDYHKHCLAMTNNVRRLINHLPPDLLQRPVLAPKIYNRHARFCCLEPKTQAILQEFLQDGRKTKDNQLSLNRLAPRFRSSIVVFASRFLNIVDKNSLLDVVPEDAQRFSQHYESRGCERQDGLNMLADLRPLFANMVGRKYTKTNPLDEYRAKINKSNNDFTMPSEMAKIQDLSTLDFKNKWAVRNRMITFALFYDFCLRCGEATLLKMSDIAIEGNFIRLNLRGGIQKGQGKMDEILFNFFPESKRLIEAYIQARNELQPTTDYFLVNQDGKPLLDYGCRHAVADCCEKLNVKTYKGRTPYPHCFRHTFGSINIASLGLCLSPYDVQQRLRHTDVQITIRIYVNNNPLLKKERHIAAIQRTAGANRMVPLQDETPIANNHPANSNDFTVAEPDALKAVRGMGITWRALRGYAIKHQLSQEKENGYLYSRSFIQDIRDNYLTKQQIMKRFKIGQSRFYVWKKSRGIEPVVIGQVSLVKKDIVFAEMKKGS